jgi:hypothetical protein
VDDSRYVPPGYVLDPSASDEFEGASLDTSKWRPCLAGGSHGDQAKVSTDNISVSNGILSLKVTTNDAGTDWYWFGGVCSLFLFPPQPSYLEVRVQGASYSSPSVDSMVFMFGPPNPVPWVTILSTEGPGILPGTTLWNVDPNGAWSLVTGGDIHPNTRFNASTDEMHIFGFERKNDRLTWSLDGREVFSSVEPNDVFGLREMTLTLQTCTLGCNPRTENYSIPNLPAVMQVDYVRTYSPPR